MIDDIMNEITEIERVKVTDLRRAAAELLNRVCYGGARIIITSSGKERAALVSVGDLERLLRLPQDEGEPQEIVARWLDQHLGEDITWEKLYLALVDAGGLLERLGVLAALPRAARDMERLLALERDEAG